MHHHQYLCFWSPSNEIKQKLNYLNCEIKTFYYSQKRKAVRKDIVPGNSKSLWSAVNASKDLGSNDIPNNMYYNKIKVPDGEVANCFATFFQDKVEKIVNNAIIDPEVYNGRRKLVAADSNFMSENDIIECVKQLKLKNCEGYDRIPQRFLIDGISILINPLTKLFSLIYSTKCIPEQWLIAKIAPLHKKGSKNHVENYRPVANLCCTSKILPM